MAANYLFVPGVAVGLLILFDANPTVAAGFSRPRGLPRSAIWPDVCGNAPANVPAAVGLMVILAGSSAIVSPVLLHALLPWVADGETPRIDLIGLVRALLITQLLHLLLGLVVTHRRPQFADKLLSPFVTGISPAHPLCPPSWPTGSWRFLDHCWWRSGGVDGVWAV